MTHSPGRLCIGPEPALEETDAKLEPPSQHLSTLPVFLVLYSGFNIHTLVRERWEEEGYQDIGPPYAWALSLELGVRAGGPF